MLGSPVFGRSLSCLFLEHPTEVTLVAEANGNGYLGYGKLALYEQFAGALYPQTAQEVCRRHTDDAL